MNKLVSYFENLTDVSSNFKLEDILADIKSGKYEPEVCKIRNLIANGEDASKLKKKLPSFTVTGIFKLKRKSSNIEQYASLLILDYDKLTKSQISLLSEKLVQMDYVYSFFISPSGKGLKVIVSVDSDADNHEIAFNQVVHVFNDLFEIPIDTSGKDIARLCFMSYDPNLFINPQVKAFKVQLEDSIDFDAAISQAIHLTERKYSYENGNRNNFIYHLACNANRLAIPKDEIKASIINNYDLDEGEVENTIKGAYANNLLEHGTNEPKKHNVDFIEELLLSRYEFRYNEITTRIEIKDKQVYEKEFKVLNDYKENSILRWLLKKGKKINQSLLRSIIRSDFSSPYNAFKSYFNSLPEYPNEVDYIKELASTVKTHNNELWCLVLKKWLVAMIACAITDKTNHTVLVLAGGQGIGKTTWMLKLIPPELSNYVFSGNINPNNRDALVQLVECLLINMDELETLNKSEIGSLKEIITKESIRIRKAYGVNQENIPRRASFSGSVNSMQFLNDSTGSRRFLCFEASEIDYKTPVNHIGIYSQAMHLFKNGFQYWLNSEEIDLINRNNEQFQIVSPEEEYLLAYFEPRARHEAELFLTNSEIINRINYKASISNNSIRPKALGNALTKCGFARLKMNGKQVYALHEKTPGEIEGQFKKV